MNFLSAAERLAAIDRSAVQLNPERCLHALDQYATCQACMGVCPAGALTEDTPPVFNEKACVRCLACLPTCPTGAFEADDSLRSLLNCAPRLPEGAVDLVCSAHPQPSASHSQTEVVIRVRGCLAGLGSGALVTLIAAGFTHLRLRTEACGACDLGQLRGQIEQQVSAARSFLSAWNMEERLELVAAPSSENVQAGAPVWDADNPPLSRRDLFRLSGRQGQIALGRAIHAEGGSAVAGAPPRERRRLLAAAAHLPGEPTMSAETALTGLSFAAVQISAECTACGVCARVCPTGALSYERDEQEARYQLVFTATDCTGCELCQHVCAPGAVMIQKDPPFHQVFAATDPEILHSGTLARCSKCNTWIDAKSESGLCPICEFRRKNPFGSALPPALRAGLFQRKAGGRP